MYTPAIILVSIPLFFSHVFAKFGMIFGTSSFERMKVYLFLILVICGIFELFLFHSDRLHKVSRDFLLRSGILLVFSALAFLFSPFSDSSMIGSHEKHHGYILLIGLIFFSWMVGFLRDDEYKKMLSLSCITAVIVGSIALLEYMGLSLFFPDRVASVSWEIGRTISTLGNPNYVAGYILIHLPLVYALIRSPWRYIVMGVLFFAIITTGSYIGIALALGYLSWVVYQKTGLNNIFFFSGCIVITIMVFLLVPHEKLLSFSSRFVLMQDVLSVFLHHPGLIISGIGSDGIISLYDGIRSDRVNSYFPPTSAIDSSHNIFLDIIVMYGAPFFLLLLSSIKDQWKLLSSYQKQGFIMGILFFSLNVIVIAPLILLIILMYASTPPVKK